MSKELSLSNNNIVKDKRNSLYYGQFRYVALFFLKEASVLRDLDARSIDRTIDFRNNWKIRVTNDERQRLHETAAHITSLTNPFKTNISYNWIYFYTNSLADIDILARNSPLTKQGKIREVVITHDKSVVGLKNPQHLYRTYIKSHRPEPHQRESLKAFVDHNSSEIRVSPGLREFLNDNKRYWLTDGYFIDHNDQRMITALALINPNLIRKTLPIVQVNS